MVFSNEELFWYKTVGRIRIITWEKIMVPFKKPSTDIFYVTIPLAAVAFLCMFIVAVLKLKDEGNPVYLIIFITGIALLLTALMPAWRMHHNHNCKYEGGSHNG